VNTALRAASLTVRDLVRRQLEADVNLRDFFDSALGGTMRVTLLTPDEHDEAESEGVSLWLYRVVRDDCSLNAPPRRRAPDRLVRTPLPLRLHYLVTPIVNPERADGPELEQNILGVILQLFHDHPLLAGSDLRGDAAGSNLEIHVRLETLELEGITRVWDALDRAYQLCVSYEVSVVPIESASQAADIAPVDAVMPEHSLIVRAT